MRPKQLRSHIVDGLGLAAIAAGIYVGVTCGYYKRDFADILIPALWIFAGCLFIYGCCFGVTVGLDTMIQLPRRLREARVQRRIKTGRCRACGYMLRGNQSGVCPECGMRFR